MPQGAWEALYQQNPIIVGGGIFPIDKLRVIPVLDRSLIQASDRLCLRANKRMQRSLDDEKYKIIFPDTVISQGKGSGYLRNTDILEFVASEGYFRNTTVGGPITGEELDLGIIDDPLKGRAEANSQVVRERIWSSPTT